MVFMGVLNVLRLVYSLLYQFAIQVATAFDRVSFLKRKKVHKAFLVVYTAASVVV